MIEEPSVSSDIRNRAEDENVISRARNSTVEVVRRLSLEYSKIANGKNANRIGIVEDNMTHWSALSI